MIEQVNIPHIPALEKLTVSTAPAKWVYEFWPIPLFVFWWQKDWLTGILLALGAMYVLQGISLILFGRPKAETDIDGITSRNGIIKKHIRWADITQVRTKRTSYGVVFLKIVSFRRSLSIDVYDLGSAALVSAAAWQHLSSTGKTTTDDVDPLASLLYAEIPGDVPDAARYNNRAFRFGDSLQILLFCILAIPFVLAALSGLSVLRQDASLGLRTIMIAMAALGSCSMALVIVTIIVKGVIGKVQEVVVGSEGIHVRRRFSESRISWEEIATAKWVPGNLQVCTQSQKVNVPYKPKEDESVKLLQVIVKQIRKHKPNLAIPVPWVIDASLPKEIIVNWQ